MRICLELSTWLSENANKITIFYLKKNYPDKFCSYLWRCYKSMSSSQISKYSRHAIKIQYSI